LVKVNLHAHTVVSDGVLPPLEMAALYRGYGALCLSDHRFDAAAYYYPSSPDVLVLGGVEVTRRELHYTVVLGDFEVLTILNHPNRYGPDRTEHYIKTMNFDALEITDHAARVPPEYETLASRYGLLRIVTDDAHRPEEVGRAWLEVDTAGVEALTLKDKVIKAIRLGRYTRYTIAGG